MSDNRRWLIKALREAANELQDQIGRALMDQNAPPEARAAAAEAAKELAKQESIAAHQIAHLVFTDNEELPLHDYEWLEDGPEGTPWDHLRLYGDLRDQIVSVLAMLSEEEWERTAKHRFRGSTNIAHIGRDLHERDLRGANAPELMPHRSADPR